jgi:uncharacterized membrane protein (UPF0127 family)
MKKVWIIFLVFFIIILLLFLAWQNFYQNKEIIYNNSSVCIGGSCFEIQLAENSLQQSRGLMFRETLSENKGMFFVFKKEANYPFWMKNTHIPLDIIWINANKEVVFISEFTEPCKTFFCPQINPQVNAKYVLEINAGLSQKFDFKVGDFVEIID